MSSAKDEVNKMIAKRRKRNSTNRMREAQQAGTTQIILEFIKAMEKVIRESDTPMDFDFGLQKEAVFLESRMKAIDPLVDLVIMWNKENLMKDWRDLQIDGVRIIWSDEYLLKNPEMQKEKHITVASLFMSGKFD